MEKSRMPRLPLAPKVGRSPTLLRYPQWGDAARTANEVPVNRTIRAALCACVLSALAGAPLPSQDLNGAVAAAVLLLVEEGRVALEDDIRDYIPEMRDYGRAVTIEHLMTHTSGVRDWTGIRMSLGRTWARLVRGDDGILSAIVGQRSLDFSPGEKWEYSNSNYVLLREVVERAGGMPFADFARTRLFEPLGLRSTRYAADVGAATGSS
jgi:hypothetical protein